MSSASVDRGWTVSGIGPASVGEQWLSIQSHSCYKPTCKGNEFIIFSLWGRFISVSVYSLANRQLIRSRLSAGPKQSSVCDRSTFLFAVVQCLQEMCKMSNRLLCVMAKFVLNRWKRLFKRHSSCCFKKNTWVQHCWSFCMMHYAQPLAFNPVITDFPSLNSSLEVLISLNNGQSFISSPITIYATICVSTQYTF